MQKLKFLTLLVIGLGLSLICPSLAKADTLPDLVITNVYFTPSTPVSGQNFSGNLVVSLANTGNVTAQGGDGIKVTVAGRKGDGSLVSLASGVSYKYLSSLAANAAVDVAFPVSDLNLNGDQLTVLTTVDDIGDTGNVIESNENNNSFSKDFSLLATTNKPDLMITDITLDPLPVVGKESQAKVNVQIKNIGNASTPAGQTIYVGAGVYDGVNDIVGNYRGGWGSATGQLQAGESTIVANYIDATFYENKALVSAWVDRTNGANGQGGAGAGIINESNENNNFLNKTFNLTSTSSTLVLKSLAVKEITANSAVIEWKTNKESIGRTPYGREIYWPNTLEVQPGPYGTKFISSNSSEYVYRTTLSNLQAGTKYHAVLDIEDTPGGNILITKDLSFTTANGNDLHLTALNVKKVGTGDGTITDSGNGINCGQDCSTAYAQGVTETVTATPDANSKFMGWFGDCEASANVSGSQICTVKLNKAKNVVAVFDSIQQVHIPRIMYWYGKVNQHWNLEQDIWETDSDGVSGANLNLLTYCQKFYPKTVKVVEYKEELTKTWKHRGNGGDYLAIKMSYRCVQSGEAVDGNDVSRNKVDTISTPTTIETNNSVNQAETISTPAAIANQAATLASDQLASLLAEVKTLRNQIQEQANQIKYLNSLLAGVKTISAEAKTAINTFITYGTDANTKQLGAGERAAVVSSYKAAYNKLPETTKDLTETIKIANGNFPSVISQSAEAKAQAAFKKVYLRAADMNNENDVAAIKVMAYGLRQKAVNRNLASEQKGIETFKNIYGHTPTTTEDWNIMQAITYSGAQR